MNQGVAEGDRVALAHPQRLGRAVAIGRRQPYAAGNGEAVVIEAKRLK
jgi:hypothetical protein